jgi:DNA-binding PadR family transcriptional regulator
MKGTQLGEFEELVLLTVAFLYDEAYSVAVMEELSRRTERPMALGVVHRTLQRLEEKGLVVSYLEKLLRSEVADASGYLR